MLPATSEDEAVVMPIAEARALLTRCIIAHQLAVALNQVIDAARFDEHLGADSLDMAALHHRLEREIGIHISDDEAAECETVGQIVALVEAKKTGAPCADEDTLSPRMTGPSVTHHFSKPQRGSSTAPAGDAGGEGAASPSVAGVPGQEGGDAAPDPALPNNSHATQGDRRHG